MERRLFLDDERQPFDLSWHVVRSYDAFVAHIEEFGTPEVISFDHDLALEHYPRENTTDNKIPYGLYREKTGYDAAWWLIETKRIDDVKVAYVHSMNAAGRINIMKLLLAARVPKLNFVIWSKGAPVLIPALPLPR